MTDQPVVPGGNEDELVGGPIDAPESDAAPLSRYRNFWRAVGGLVVVALIAILGPDLLAASDPPDPRPTESALPTLPDSRFVGSSPPPVGPLDWPVRGDLVDDASFVDAALDRVRESDPAAAKVLFAGELPDGGRIALVAIARSDPVSDMGRGVHMRALHVPPGADLARTQVEPEPLARLMDEEDLTGWAARITGGRIVAVVLGRPAPLAVEASPLIRYSRNGGAIRRWQPLSAPDGAAVADLGSRSDHIVVVRSQVVETRTYPLVLPVANDPRADLRTTSPLPDPQRVTGLLDASYRGPDAQLVVEALADGHEYRFDPTTADLKVLWSGEVEPDRPSALVRARRPDGPTFQVLVTAGGTGAPAHGPRHVPWAVADVTPWLFVQGDPDDPVLILSPSGRGTALLTEAGSPPRRVPIGANGIGVFEDTQQGRMFTSLSGARLAIVSPAGEILVSSSLPSLGIDDVFVLR